MFDSKNIFDRDRKGSISYTLGDRKYFGSGIENIFDKSKGYYGNVHQRVFEKFK